MASNILTNVAIATSANQTFHGVVSNDWILNANSNQSIWLGTRSPTTCNFIQITPSNVSVSNMTVSGVVDFSAASGVLMPASFVAAATISSNQAFSNVYSSNGTFSNLLIAANGLVDFSGAADVLMPASFVSVQSNQAFSNVYSSNVTASNVIGSNVFGSIGTFCNLDIAAVSSSRIRIGRGVPLLAPTLMIAQITGSNFTASNITASGVVDFSGASNILMPPSFVSVQSNQSFSNVYSSNVTASNAAFSNLSISAVSSSRITVGNSGPLIAPTMVIAQVTGSNGTFSNVTGSNAAFSNLSSSNVVASNIVCSGSVSAGNLGMFRNFLINGGMMVNQRNITATSIPGDPGALVGGSNAHFIADRWMAFRSGWTAGGTMSNLSCTTADLPYIQDGVSNYVRIGRASGNTANHDIALIQNLESIHSKPLAGKSVTLSFYARKGAGFSGSVLNHTIRCGISNDQNLVANNLGLGGSSIDNTINLTTSWEKYTLSGIVPLTTTQLGIKFLYNPSGTAGASDYYDITGIQLEKGTIATPFEFRPYPMELQLCQRYYEVIVRFTLQCAMQNATRYASAMYRQDKRVMPTVTLINNPENASYDAAYSSIQQASIKNAQGNYFTVDILSSAEL